MDEDDFSCKLFIWIPVNKKKTVLNFNVERNKRLQFIPGNRVKITL